MTPLSTLFVLALSAPGLLAGPINRQVGISENVFITVQNDTYGNEQRVCSIDSVTYVDGDSIPTSSPCEHCICRPPGFACTIISCEYRPGCKVLKRSNQCCPEYQCECEKDGKIYQNGEKILDNNNPCEVCYCQGGDVICAVIDCYWRSDCQPRYIENRCCPLYDHCPPPSGDLGPIRPTQRTTTTTTTPVPIWFNQTIVESKPSPGPQEKDQEFISPSKEEIISPPKEEIISPPKEEISPIAEENIVPDAPVQIVEIESPIKIIDIQSPVEIVAPQAPIEIIDLGSPEVVATPQVPNVQEETENKVEGSEQSVWEVSQEPGTSEPLIPHEPPQILEGEEVNEIVSASPPAHVLAQPIRPVVESSETEVVFKETDGPQDPKPISLVDLKAGSPNEPEEANGIIPLEITTTLRSQEVVEASKENLIIEQALVVQEPELDSTTTVKSPVEVLEIKVPSIELLPPKEDPVVGNEIVEENVVMTSVGPGEEPDATTSHPHSPVSHGVEKVSDEKEEIPQTTSPVQMADESVSPIPVTQISFIEDEKSVEESKGEITTQAQPPSDNETDEETERTTEKAGEKGESEPHSPTTIKYFGEIAAVEEEITAQPEDVEIQEIQITTSLPPQDKQVEVKTVEDEKAVEEMTTFPPTHNFRFDPSIFDDDEEENDDSKSKTVSPVKFIEPVTKQPSSFVEEPRKDIDVETTIEPKIEPGRNEFRILSFDSEEQTTASEEKVQKSDFEPAHPVVTEIPHDLDETTMVGIKVEGNLRDDIIVTTEIPFVPHSDDVELKEETTVVPIDDTQNLFRHHHPDHHGHDEEVTTQREVISNDETSQNVQDDKEKIEIEVRENESEVTTIPSQEKPQQDPQIKGINEKPEPLDLVDNQMKGNEPRFDLSIEITTENPIEPQTGESVVEEIATTIMAPLEEKQNETMKKTEIVIPKELIKKAEPISDDINLVEERGRWGLYDNGVTNEVANADETWLWRNRVRNIPQFPQGLRRRSRKPRETIGKVDEFLMEKTAKVKKPSFHHKKVKWPVYKQRESMLS